MSSIQQIPFVSVNQIIQTLIYRLASHPWLREAIITNDTGNKITINRIRNFGGKELKNPMGLTLSVYPYTYASNPDKSMTVGSRNATVQFKGKNDTLGANGQDITSHVEATMNIAIVLDAFGFSQKGSNDNDAMQGQQLVFEFNEVEMLLRQYLDLIFRVLIGNDMRRLPRFIDNQPLLANSWVDQMNWPTSSWTQSANSILHSASIIWQAVYYVPHEWRLPVRYVPIDIVDGLLPIGTMTIGDYTGPIFYDTVSLKFVDDEGREVVRDDLNVGGTLAETLNADFMSLVDGAPKGMFDFSMYHKRVEDGWE